MKTEMEILKENTEKERKRQQLDEIVAYIDTRRATIHATLPRIERNMLWMGGSTITLAITMFTGPEWATPAAGIGIWWTIYRHHVVLHPIVAKADSEITGLLDCLVILGMAEFTPPDDRHKKKRKVKKESKVAASWELLKKKLRREAYV